MILIMYTESMRKRIQIDTNKKLNRIRKVLLVLVLALVLMGCGEEEETSDVNYFYHSMNEEDSDTDKADEDMEEKPAESFMVMAINGADQSMRVYRYSNGMEYQYYYGMATDFRDKYGEHISAAGFSVGDVIHISNTNKYGKVTKVQKSDDVWTYDDITRFKVDLDRGVLKIADKNYKLTDETFVFSNDKRAAFDDITQNDTLSVIGQGKEILSVCVTTGHGYLRLKNTKLFEGSFLQLDTNIFSEIVPDMELEVEEGTYTLAVANNGWGGTAEVVVERGDTTYVDLDKLKGEGPKKGRIQFRVDVEGADIYIDDQKIDYARPVELEFGLHYLMVNADGFDTWTRNLYVNSDEGTIMISLRDQDDTVTTEEMIAQQPENAPTPPNSITNSNSNTANSNSNHSNNNTSNNAGSNNNTNSNDSLNSNNNSSGNQSISESDLKDYLSTITTLLNAISS